MDGNKIRNSRLKICLFGTYYRSYSRNITLIEGLRRNDIEFIEIHKEPLMERFDRREDLTLTKFIRRIKNKIKLYGYFVSSYRDVMSTDVILVLYPSQLLLPLAWLMGKVLKKTVIFDSFVSLYDSMVLDKSIVPQGSVMARIVLNSERMLLRMNDKIVVDTKSMRAFFIEELKVPAEKIFVVPIGTNDKLYKPKEKKIENKINVLFFGYYNPLQGAIYIVKAAKLLKDRKNIKFTMIGDGTTKSEVVRFAKENNLKNVSFLPNIPESDLVNHIQKSDIMLGIFSNISTAQRVIPNKVYAAIACRKALISAKLPALDEYFEDNKNISYCKAENPESLASAILKLSSDNFEMEKIAKNGYQLYTDIFSPQAVVGVLLKNL